MPNGRYQKAEKGKLYPTGDSRGLLEAIGPSLERALAPANLLPGKNA